MIPFEQNHRCTFYSISKQKLWIKLVFDGQIWSILVNNTLVSKKQDYDLNSKLPWNVGPVRHSGAPPNDTFLAGVEPWRANPKCPERETDLRPTTEHSPRFWLERLLGISSNFAFWNKTSPNRISQSFYNILLPNVCKFLYKKVYTFFIRLSGWCLT